jgi:sulfatase modifying factor 1
MFFHDDALAPPQPQTPGSGEGGLKNRTRQNADAGENAVHATKLLAPGERKLNPERPFHNHPKRRNRRERPWQKGLVIAGFFMTGIVGYLLGHSHKSTSSIADQPGERPASSSATAPQDGLVHLPDGSFAMGDMLDGLKDARSHQVSLTPFMMAKHEVTFKLWDSVVLWGRDHGYPDLPAGNGKAHDHPVYGISWVDAVKWCNALSEKEGLTPCYYSEASRQNVARKGSADIGNQQVKWEANGYRLPTEAEWEFAARGGLADKRFPWGNEITHEQANYHGSPLIDYDKSQHEGAAPQLMSSKPYTAAVGSFQTNGFGLYDMAGNVSEWCWDFYDPNYGTPEPQLNNPRGPDKGKNCVVRGGSWRNTAAEARCASRFSLPGDQPVAYVGFRVVRGR